MAVLAITLAGQAVGAAVGGSILGISAATIGGAIGMAVGNYFFGPKPQDQVGPQLKELDTATAGEGAPIPVMWGSMRVPGHIIWAPKLTQRTRKTKISGGKGGGNDATATTFYATGTWAISFGYNRDGIARSLRRVWANKKLVYDAGGTTGGATTAEGFAFTYYDGTQTTADPTMEGIIGEGNVPAYTGQAMLVFEDLNLESYGNRIPSIEAELVDDATSTVSVTDINLHNFGYEDGATSNGWIWKDPNTGLVWVSFIGSGVLGAGNEAAIFVVNPDTRKVVWHKLNTPTASTAGGGMWLISYNSLYDRVLYDAGTVTEVYDTSNFALLGSYSRQVVSRTAPIFRGVFFVDSGLQYWRGDGESVDTVTVPTGYTASNHAVAVKKFALDILGDRDTADDEAHIFLHVDASSLSEFGYFRVNPPVIGSPTLTAIVSSYASTAHQDGYSGFKLPDGSIRSLGVYVDVTDSYWFAFSGTATPSDALIEVAPSTGEIIGYYSLKDRLGIPSFGWGTEQGNPYLSYDARTRRLWFTGVLAGACWFSVVSKTGKAYSIADFATAPVVYTPSTGEIMGPQWDDTGDPQYDRIFFIAIDRIDQGGIAVSSVIRDVCIRAGVPSSAVTFANVTASVTGAISNQRSPARSIINALAQYAYADGYESEYQLKFKGRGAAVATTLSDDYVGAIQPNGSPNQTEVVNPHHVELPKSLDLRFYNSDNDFQIGDALYTWYTSESERKATLNMPVAITPQQALTRAATILHAMYERTPYKFTVGPRYAAVEPTDVVTLPLNSRNERIRIERVRRGVNGIREIEALQDSSQAAESYASVGGHTGRDARIVNYGSNQIFWLDTPLLQDTDANIPGPYVACYNYASGFQFGALYTSPDNNSYAEAAQFDSEPAYGLVQNVPEDISDFGQWDRDNTLTVSMLDGASELESISSAALFAGGNAVAYGRPGRWEIIQYLSVVVASSGEREISSLLRGRRGTNGYVNTHQASDWFVVLTPADWTRLNYAVADIGDTVYTRTVRPGQSYADVAPTVFSVTNTALRPYSPISVFVASASTGGDLEATWTRRTRIGGSYVGLYDNVGGSLNEDSELYEIDIVNTASGSVVVSAIATTSTNFFYASTAQASDGTTNLGTISFRVFQISAAVGRGFRASATYERPWETGLKYAIGIGSDYYLPLDDAANGAAVKDYYGSAVGIWGASVGIASGSWLGSLQRATASCAISASTGAASLRDTFQTWANGKNAITVAGWVEPDTWSGGESFLEIPSDTSNLGLRINKASSQLRGLFKPTGGGGGNTSLYTLTTPEQTNPVFATFVCNASANTQTLFCNGQAVDSDAATGATTITWTSYSSARPCRLGATLNGNSQHYNGRMSDWIFFPTALSSATVSTLFEKQNGYIDRVTALGGTHLWTLDQRTSKFTSTEPDRVGNADLTTTYYQAEQTPVMPTVRYGGNFATNYYARRTLPSDMKTQVFTFDGWFNLDTLQSSAPMFAALPAGANASAKGLYIQQNGSTLSVKYGPGDGVWREISGTCSAGAPTYWAVAKASAAAPVLFINGSAVGAGASVFDIDWVDATGTPAPPAGTLYINRANFARTADASADTAGIDGKMNLIAAYGTALSSATIMSSYLFGLKRL